MSESEDIRKVMSVLGKRSAASRPRKVQLALAEKMRKAKAKKFKEQQKAKAA